MPSLKALRLRIQSVKQTQKITSAMKMVAASKLRRAQEGAEAARPYAERMERMLVSLAETYRGREEAPPMLVGTESDQTHLLLVATADRGLCGAFNGSIVRAARQRIRALQEAGKSVKILCVGRKGRDQLRREYGELIVDTITGLGRHGPTYAEAEALGRRLAEMFDGGEFDIATIIYNRFRTVMTQIVTFQQLIPFRPVGQASDEGKSAAEIGVYEFEPDEQELLAELLPRNLAVQLLHAMLENAASEQGARMTAMDNATRNAADMIDRLTLTYNRTRQAAITKELIEIISGAEAL